MTTEELKVKISVDMSDLKADIGKAKKEINGVTSGSKQIGSATKDTSKSMEELKDTMTSIRNLQVFELVSKSLESVTQHTEALTKNLGAVKKHLKDAVAEFKLGFDKKHWEDLGYNDSTFSNIKTMSKEAGASIAASFGHAKLAVQSFGAAAVAALGTVAAKAAVLVSMLIGIIALMRNALRVSALGKEMNVLAQQAGMSIDAYQRWAFVLQQIGLSVDDMIGAQQTLLEAQVDVREGAEDMIGYFKQIGLSQEEVLGMNQQQLFERTVEGLQNVENATERASLAYKLLSEDSKNLAPLLNLSSQEVATLANNFNTLNGAMSEGLIQTSNRLQASLGNMRAAWQGLKNTLAEVVLPVVITVVNWFTKAIAIVNLFLRTVFGLEMSGAASSSMENAASGVGSYTESMEQATEAAQKLKRTVMGFDELNIVGNPNSGSGSSAGDAGTGGLGGSFAGGATDSLFGADSIDMSKWQEFFAKYKNLIQDISTWGLIGIGVGVAVLGALTANIPLVIAGLGLAGIGFAIGNVEDGTFDRLAKKFKDMNLGFIPSAMVGIGAIGSVVALLMGNIPLAIALAAMAGIGLSLGGGSDIAKLVDTYSQEIQSVIAPSMIAIGAVLTPLALMTGNIPLALIGIGLAGLGLALGGLANGSIKGFVDEYSAQLTVAISAATVAIGVVGCVIALLTGNIPVAIAFAVLGGIAIANIATGGTFFTDLVEALKGVWTGLKTWFVKNVKPIFTKQWWVNLFSSIKEGASAKLGEVRTTIMNIWNNIKDYFNTNIAPKFTLAYWQAKFETIKQGIQTKMGEARITIMNAWNSIREYFNTNIAPKFTLAYWKTKFENIRKAIGDKLVEVRNTLTTQWETIKKWFNSSIAPKFTLTYWKNKFNTIKDGAKAAFNGIISIVETAINSIVKKVNTISWKIPDYVPKFGGKKFGFDLKTVKIPRLATGGIAVNSTLANIGENGAEAVLPLENNTSWMDQLADKIAARNSAPTKIILKVGEKELGWATINSINGITKQTGGLQLQLV